MGRHEDLDWWTHHASGHPMDRRRCHPREPRVGTGEQQRRHQALVHGRQAGLEEDHPRKHHAPSAPQCPADLRDGHAAVEQLLAGRDARLQRDQVGELGRQRHAASLGRVLPPVGLRAPRLWTLGRRGQTLWTARPRRRNLRTRRPHVAAPGRRARRRRRA